MKNKNIEAKFKRTFSHCAHIEPFDSVIKLERMQASKTKSVAHRGDLNAL